MRIFTLYAFAVLLIAISAQNAFAADANEKPTDDKREVFAANVMAGFQTADFSAFLGTSKRDDVTCSMGSKFIEETKGNVPYKKQPGYVWSVELRYQKRAMGIAIFESSKLALSALEWRRTSRGNIIEKGGGQHDEIDQWWFGKEQAYLLVLRGNLIFEASVQDKTYSDVEKELWEAEATFLGMAKNAMPMSQCRFIENLWKKAQIKKDVAATNELIGILTSANSSDFEKEFAVEFVGKFECYSARVAILKMLVSKNRTLRCRAYYNLPEKLRPKEFDYTCEPNDKNKAAVEQAIKEIETEF